MMAIPSVTAVDRMVGDTQMRELDGKSYQFRCIDTDCIDSAGPTTLSNAVPELLATPVTAGDIWGGYTMNSELFGEGTEGEPYLIRSESD